MRKHDQKDWDIFVRYVLLLGSTMKIVAPSIDDAMDIGLIRPKDLVQAKADKKEAERLIIIANCFRAAVDKVAEENGGVNG
jgi:hypothetical protein